MRVGGWEHLASFARIAGLGFDPVHNLTALAQLLAQHADKKLVLIDTPGFGPSDREDLDDLATWLGGFHPLDVHLVLPATLRIPVSSRLLDRFSCLKPTKLLLTHAEEVESEGSLLNIAMKSGLPLSYISRGQTIPEDIEQASKAALLAAVSARSSSRNRQEAA